MNRVTENLLIAFFGGLVVLSVILLFAEHASKFSPNSCNTNVEALAAAVQFHKSILQGGDFENANQTFLQSDGKIEVTLVYRSAVPGLHTAKYKVFADCTVDLT